MDEASNTPKSSSNTFLNDGSFLEKFKKIQEIQQQKDKAQESTETSRFSSVPLVSASNSRVTKSGAVVAKLSGVKKRTDKTKKLRDVGVKKVFKGSSSSESEEGE